jgi:hypothetical protein
VCAGIDKASLNEVAAGTDSHAVQCDVASEADVKRFDETIALFGSELIIDGVWQYLVRLSREPIAPGRALFQPAPRFTARIS